MRLLILTQAVDEEDRYLSFFALWLRAFGGEFDHIHVVCLQAGKYSLPENVTVHSLGKEKGASKLHYLIRFFKYLWCLRSDYDAVLVHMNQEYVLLGGVLWRLMGKRIYLWRNHYAGSFLTSLAVLLCDKVFCTSKFAYTAGHPKNVFMPVGVDTERFKPIKDVERMPRSILFFARFAPSKHPDLLLEALKRLRASGVQFRASFYGSALPSDAAYRERVMKDAKGMEGVSFYEGVPNAEAPRIFSGHEVFVNLGRSGMYDKMIFEAAACGALVLAASKDFAAHVDPQFAIEESGSGLAEKLTRVLELREAEKARARDDFRKFAESQSLSMLSERLHAELSL